MIGVTLAQAAVGAGLHLVNQRTLVGGVSLAQAYAGAGLYLEDPHALV